jgi:hypothetical protein
LSRSGIDDSNKFRQQSATTLMKCRRCHLTRDMRWSHIPSR